MSSVLPSRNAPTSPERRQTLQLPDGRRLAWSEWGPRDGQVVLFCTGAGMSGALGFGTDALPSMGLRLVAPDRPGLSGSDPDSRKSFTSLGQNVRALLAHLGAAGPLAVGFSQEAPFAFALAAEGHVAAVAVVSGQDDLAHPALRRLVIPQVVGMVEEAGRDPARLVARLAGMADAVRFWTLVRDTSSTRGHAIYTEAELGATQRAGLAEGFASEPGGHARDTALAMGS